MDTQEFYNYIQEQFHLGGAAGRLVLNIIKYVEEQGFVGAEDARAHLLSLLDGTFGIEEHEVYLYRAPCCRICGEYVASKSADEGDDTLVCESCEDAK